MPPTVFRNGIPATETIDKASLFNKYFLVFTIELPANPDQFDPTARCHLLSIQVSEQEVLDALISLSTDKATGIDCIGAKMMCLNPCKATAPPTLNCM